MDLKNTINNTNTQKENIKTVANNIDNKLVELGGEQAKDLSDVPNKMGAMVTGNYLKYAVMKTYKKGSVTANPTIYTETNPQKITINLDKQLEFLPEAVYVNLGELHIGSSSERKEGVINNLEYKRMLINSMYACIKIGNIERNSIEIFLYFDYNANYDYVFNYTVRQIECFSKEITGKEY